MDPIHIAIKLIQATFTLSRTLGTGALGDSYELSLYSWRESQTDIRGEFYLKRSRKYEAPTLGIISPALGSFLAVEEHGLVNEDGSIEIVARNVSREPFPITRASRESWRCAVPGTGDVRLARISRTADFKLLLVARIPIASRMLDILGGHSRLHLRFPGSQFALSPCDGRPEGSGQNILGSMPGFVPRTEPIHVRPAVMKGTSVIPWSARVIVQPQRVNWTYWDAEAGYGPTIVFEGYCADPRRQAEAPTE